MQAPSTKRVIVFSLRKEGVMSLYKGMSLLLRKCVFDIDTHILYLCHVIFHCELF